MPNAATQYQGDVYRMMDATNPKLLIVVALIMTLIGCAGPLRTTQEAPPPAATETAAYIQYPGFSRDTGFPGQVFDQVFLGFSFRFPSGYIVTVMNMLAVYLGVIPGTYVVKPAYNLFRIVVQRRRFLQSTRNILLAERFKSNKISRRLVTK